MEAIKAMTVAQLKDIIDSQIIIYGNAALFVRNKHDFDSFTLFAGDEAVLECFGYDEADPVENGLSATLARLNELETEGAITEATKISCDDGDIQNEDFEIGFISNSDGFVQTVSLSELEIDTQVAEF